MKNKIVLVTGLTIALTLIQFLIILPWWSFVIPIFILGLALPNESAKKKSFLTGFISGFLSWILPQLYFEFMYEGEIMYRVSDIFGIPYFLVLTLTGCIGGALSGLGFISGKLLKSEVITKV